MLCLFSLYENETIVCLIVIALVCFSVVLIELACDQASFFIELVLLCRRQTYY